MPPETLTEIGPRPPARSKVAGGLAALACAACCALPPLIALGLLTAGTAAVLQKTLLAVAAGLAVLGLGLWWLHQRRATKAPATSNLGHTGDGCARGACSCR